jgi:hypothetical protein
MIEMLKRSLKPTDPGRPALVAFALAALALGVAGYFHGHLYHEGYRQVSVVGPLFFLNVIGTASVMLLLIGGLVLPFVGGVLSISLGAIVSIIISHSSSFFRFAEAGYQTTAVVIIVAESVAVLSTLVGLVLARERLTAAMAGTAVTS